MANTALDLRGQVNGYLTAETPAGYSTKNGAVWVVRCRCGKVFNTPASSFKKQPRGAIPRSCGCYIRQHRSHRYKGVGDLSSTRWRNIRGHALRKDLAFDITIEYAWGLYVRQDKCCALSGMPLFMHPNNYKKGITTASLDRIDSARGYVVGNVQWVHVVLNDMKSNMPQDEFIRWCKMVAYNFDTVETCGQV